MIHISTSKYYRTSFWHEYIHNFYPIRGLCYVTWPKLSAVNNNDSLWKNWVCQFFSSCIMNGKDDDQSSLSETVQELENMLDKTSSANTLLRPQFWKMGVSRFCSGFSEQFLCSGSAHEVMSMYRWYLCLPVILGLSRYLDRKQMCGWEYGYVSSAWHKSSSQLCRRRQQRRNVDWIW